MSFIIGLDLDGVCYHFERTARYMLRRRISDRGDAVPEMLFRPMAYWNEVQEVVSKEDWRWLWSDGVQQGLFRYGHVVGGSIEGVQALNELGDVIAVTSRPKQAVHDTLVWLSTMFDKAPLSGIVIQSFGQKKSEVSPRPNVYIDDAPHNVDDILANTRSYAVLYDTPWNQHVSTTGSGRLVRAYGWDAVVEAVTQVKKEAS